jgi:cell division protein FtsZ
MAEFDAIGRTIGEFAADDATVVIGTVLDPDMREEIRVTVVATGLNRAQPARVAVVAPIGESRVSLVGGRQRPADGYPQSPRIAVGAGGRGSVPAVAGAPAAAAAEPAPPPPGDYLDIPAFLRRQAD